MQKKNSPERMKKINLFRKMYWDLGADEFCETLAGYMYARHGWVQNDDENLKGALETLKKRARVYVERDIDIARKYVFYPLTYAILGVEYHKSTSNIRQVVHTVLDAVWDCWYSETDDFAEEEARKKWSEPWMEKEAKTMDKCRDIEDWFRANWTEVYMYLFMFTTVILLAVVLYTWLYKLPQIDRKVNEVLYPHLLTEDQIIERYGDIE